MRQKQHRISIFLDDEELKRVYDAVAEEKMIPSRLVRKALVEYLNKLEERKGKKEVALKT
jgi:metal-responsive CopG/Arc/MetJ family transcriptional regulator